MILREVVDLIDIACKSIGGEYSNIRICELGDQLMDLSPYKTGKDYLISRGVREHISLDLNGKNGALKVDLSKPINKWNEYFDIVTDYGTIEHINDQYNVFKNVHNVVCFGGAIIHTIPQIGYYKTHCNFHYDVNFFTELSSMNGYNVVLLESRTIRGRRGNRGQNLICCILIKGRQQDFMGETDFYKNKGLDVSSYGNNK